MLSAIVAHRLKTAQNNYNNNTKHYTNLEEYDMFVRGFTRAANTTSMYLALGTLLAAPNALLGGVVGLMYYGPKGLLQTAGVVNKDNENDNVVDVAVKSAKGVAKCTFFGGTAWFQPVIYPAKKAYQSMASKKH